jgi:hypothetical protein
VEVEDRVRESEDIGHVEVHMEHTLARRIYDYDSTMHTISHADARLASKETFSSVS